MEISNSLRTALLEYKKGKQDAFTIIYKESEKYIYSCIYKVAQGNVDAVDMTADVMSDTYLEISQSVGQLEDIERFLSWAGTIATRKCYAYIKKNKKYVLVNEDDTTFENLSDDDSIIPEEIMQNREAQRLLREIIDKELTEIQKLCIIGVYYNEQKQSEIARELGIPENTVKTNLSRAKAKIKAGVEELNIKKGTKLFSVAPLLLLFFTEDVKACEVPTYIGAKILGSVRASAGATGVGTLSGTTKGGATGAKGLISKITSASLKAKIIGTAATVAVASAGVGTGVTVHNRLEKGQKVSSEKNDEIQADTWQEAYTDFLMHTEDAIDKFDVHDFDGDGSPELIGSNENGDFWLFTFKNKKLKSIVTWINEEQETIYDKNGGTRKIIYGYGLQEDEIIRVDDGNIVYDDASSRRIQESWIFNYQNDVTEPNKYYVVHYFGEESGWPFGPDTCSYAVGENGDMTNWSLDEGPPRVQEIIFNQFVAIDYTPVRSEYITEHNEDVKEIIHIRLREYENMGNRKPVPAGLLF